MEQPLFSCAKCFRNFPQSEMSRSGQTCKTCNPHHSSFKQCDFCKSDFKYYVYGNICPKCQSLKAKYGDPQICSICRLTTAFGNALVCQRCLHYRMRFGEPRECQTCGQMCAFLKDDVSRQKVDGQILCWVCTYNFKLARSRERSDQGFSKRRNDIPDSLRSKAQVTSNNDLISKRMRTDDYNPLKSDGNLTASQPLPSSQTQNMESMYNEHMATINQLQDEIKNLKLQVNQKTSEMLSKDRTIADLRSEMIEMKASYEDRLLKAKAFAQTEQERLLTLIKQLQREKITLSQGIKKRKSSANLSILSTPLRASSSSVALFNPDSPITIVHDRSVRKSEKSATYKNINKNKPVEDGLPISLKLDADRKREVKEHSPDPREVNANESTKSENLESDQLFTMPADKKSELHSPSISPDDSSDDADDMIKEVQADEPAQDSTNLKLTSDDLFGQDSQTESEDDN